MRDSVISARGLSKSYAVTRAGARPTTLAEAVITGLKKPFARFRNETFWALEDVSFDVSRGEVLGVVGRNGAGKSTLLKILSQITTPTRGEVDLFGKVGSLLEVGAGFHPELTGRENIYLNGAILGMRRSEIKRRFDEIVAFSEVGDFLETPVKRYSSGMYVRLAFSVAAHMDPDILIVDEVLAVGDAQFQKKCLGKMGEVSARDGRTVLFVSHNLATLSTLCSRCLLLERGRLVAVDEIPRILSRYLVGEQASVYTAPPGRDEPDRTLVERAWLENAAGAVIGAESAALRAGDEFTLKAVLRLRASHAVEFVASFYDPLRRPLWCFSNTLFKKSPLPCNGCVEVSLRYRLPRLNVSALTVDLAIMAPGVHPALDMPLNALTLPVAGEEDVFQITGSDQFPLLVAPEYEAVANE
jgi:ABC-type polysaccharide/polyol phosphate transport system ATPase subunit